MTPAAVIFDLDGTLFDHPRSAANGLTAWLAQLGHAATGELKTAWFAAEATHFPTWLAGTISYAEQARRRLRDFLPLIGRPVDDDATLDVLFTEGYFSAYRAAWCPYDDAKPALSLLHTTGVRMGVLTNGRISQQNAKLEVTGMTGLLGPVVTAEEIGVAKPDPRAFHAACQRMRVAPHQALYVGDHHATDVIGARAAGLAAVHLDRTSAGPFDEPARITTLDQLAQHLGFPA